MLIFSEGGMIRLETLIELKPQFENFELVLIEIRQTVPCRAIRGDSISVNSALPPLLKGTSVLKCMFLCRAIRGNSISVNTVPSPLLL